MFYITENDQCPSILSLLDRRQSMEIGGNSTEITKNSKQDRMQSRENEKVILITDENTI